MRGNNRRERKKWVKKWRKESKAQTDLNLVNCQREGLPYQIPGENRGPSYLLALQPAANHLYLIVRHKLYEDQLGIWPQSFLRHWIGVSASRESTEGCSRHVMCTHTHWDCLKIFNWLEPRCLSGWSRSSGHQVLIRQVSGLVTY